MSNDTTFIAKVTHILATWLNPVNKAVFWGIGTGPGGIAPESPADVRQNLGLTPVGGAALIGNDTAGGSLGANVQEALDLKAATASLFTDPRHRYNSWDDAATAGNAQQTLEYIAPGTGTGADHGAWVGLVHSAGTSTDNIVALVGHAYHDNAVNGGALWGIATEAWSNEDGGAVLIGGELSVIAQSPTGTNVGSVGMNAVFKNRSDVSTHPIAPIGDGSLYNDNSIGVYITSQARPSGAGAAWAGVGSGWQTAIKVGDPGFGSGLDWEGGSFFPQSSVYKSYSTIIDLTDALQDLAGGTPWFALYRNAQTYWGMRFNGMLTGALQNHNFKINNGGAGYANGNLVTVGGAGGNSTTLVIGATSGGVVTDLTVYPGGAGAGNAVAAGVATTTVTGGGAGLTIDITLSTGSLYGAWVDVAVGGAGYIVGELVALSGGGTAGYKSAVVEVMTVAAGVVTSVRLRTGGSFSLGRGYTVAVIATTSITGAGAGLTLSVAHIWVERFIGGEKWEWWRMLNPGDPYGTGARHGYIDASFPGTPLTIDTSAATYTFPFDAAL